jgi:23S rRNA (uracil1939-C5)-methyltransferase
MKTEIVSLDIYTYGGEVMGRLRDERAVFVPFAIPGERVRVRLTEEKKRYARGELVEVLEASSIRIEARCQHFLECGGCHYQHIPYEAQLEAKREILRDQLRRIGKLDDPIIKPTIASPTPWNYRNYVQFHLTPEGLLGYQKWHSRETMPIQECHLPADPINETWPRLDLDTIPGLDRVGLRSGAEGEVLLNLESSDPQPISLRIDLPISVVHSGPAGSIILAGDDHLAIEVAGRIFKVSAGSFFQINTPLVEGMVNNILENLPIPEKATLIDAYCGVGLFSAFLAPKVGRLIGIEVSPIACDDFVTNLDDFDHVELYEAPVREVLPALEADPDILIVDPPRGGLDRPTVDAVLVKKPKDILYISCDPATLARDLKRLTKGGYRLAHSTPIDLFPQTFHIETINFLHQI